MEKKLSPQESFNIIEDMIRQAKNKLTEDGYFFLLWGWLVSAASVACYVLVKTDNKEFAKYPWFIMLLVGVPFSIYKGYKKNTAGQGHDQMSQIINKVWQSFGIAMFCTILSTAWVAPQFQGVCILIVVGMATFATGRILKFTPLVIGGLIFFAGAILSCVFTGPESLLVNALCTVLGYLVPGYLLKNDFKKQNLITNE